MRRSTDKIDEAKLEEVTAKVLGGMSEKDRKLVDEVETLLQGQPTKQDAKKQVERLTKQMHSPEAKQIARNRLDEFLRT
ncbi:MAG TPA: hypothetical protein VFA61_11880 [Candidatus Udaeobacter sp.]|nr:hypothetical protein [Candidatus Udaeobacter sp.]